jgi:hypothetical protein
MVFFGAPKECGIGWTGVCVLSSKKAKAALCTFQNEEVLILIFG